MFLKYILSIVSVKKTVGIRPVVIASRFLTEDTSFSINLGTCDETSMVF